MEHHPSAAFLFDHQMRPLSEDETKKVFEKLVKYVGGNLEQLINRQDERHTFRYLDKRVYYVSETIMKMATNFSRENLLALGTCVGKFTKTDKFLLSITFLDYIAQHAKYKVWVKPSSEMSFLYGNNILKSGLGRMTEGIPQYAGVVVYSMTDVPLGFGILAQPTEYCKDLDPTANVVLHQADIGEYLRVEDELS